MCCIKGVAAGRSVSMAIAVFLVVTVGTTACVAQGAQGENAVYSGTSSLVGSTAFIDANAFYTSGNTVLCTILNSILTSGTYPAGGAVIDARGIPTPQTCSTDPFAGGTTPPSTVLLPPGQIIIGKTWTLPDHTRIIGTGRTQTTLFAQSGFVTSNTAMIQMCTSACSGVSVSDLQLSNDCQCTTDPGVFNGIVNKNAQEFSYVNNVNFRYIEGTSLDVETSGADNSGPYTDLNITMGGQNCATIPSPTCFPKLTTACIELKDVSTRGVHSFTCTSDGDPYAGIYVDGDNNSIEDGHFEGLVDGIRVGQNSNAAGTVITNISGASGATGQSSGPLTNVVHLCGPNAKTTACSSSQTVSDTTLLNIETYTSLHDSVVDDASGTELGSVSGDQGVSLYILGEAYPNLTSPQGYSRFSTSTMPVSASPVPVPSWGTGTLGSTSSPSGTCPSGTIFSNTNGTATHALWLCVNGAWKNVK